MTFTFTATLGLCCCTQAFSSCSEWGLLFSVVCGRLIAVASLVEELRLSSCDTGLVTPWQVESSWTRG